MLSLKPFSTLSKKFGSQFYRTFHIFPRNRLLMLSSILPDTFVRNTLSSFQCSHPFWKWPTPAKLYATLSLGPCQHPWTIILASSISAVNPRTLKDIWENLWHQFYLLTLFVQKVTWTMHLKVQITFAHNHYISNKYEGCDNIFISLRSFSGK